MTRKDAVIIASLVNGAVLALLMILAVDVEEPKGDKPLLISHTVKVEPRKEEIVLKAKEIKKPEVLDKGDEIIKVHFDQTKNLITPSVPKEEVPIPLVTKEKPKIDEEWYIVKSGDNPWKIAKSEKIDYEDILKLNQMTEHKAKNLKPGDRIRIR